MTSKNVMVLIVALMLCAAEAVAADKVVVVPLFKNSTIKNVITVAQEGGDFSDPVAALNSISDATSSNQYLVFVGPGEYTVSSAVKMKSYVHLMGAGQKVTTIKGAVSSPNISDDSAIIAGATNAQISDMKILNSGGDVYSIGIINFSYSSPLIERVDVQAWGGTTWSFGVYNYYSNPVITDSLLYGSGIRAYGVYNHHSSPTFLRISADAWLDENDGEYGFGIRAYSNSFPVIRYSTLSGPDYSIQVDGTSTAHLSYTTLKDGKDTISLTSMVCAHCDNDLGVELNEYCAIP